MKQGYVGNLLGLATNTVDLGAGNPEVVQLLPTKIRDAVDFEWQDVLLTTQVASMPP